MVTGGPIPEGRGEQLPPPAELKSVADKPGALNAYSPPSSSPGSERYELKKEYELGSISVSRDGTALVSLGNPNETKVTWSEARLKSLNSMLDDIEEGARTGDIRRVIYTTPGTDCFIFGADLKEFLNNNSVEDFERAINAGHTLFSRNAALPIKTVAAVQGACVGGGLEFVLSCDEIVATKTPKTEPFKGDKTVFSFPEIQLGIFPGWGGTARAVDKIGLQAFELVLTGKPLTVDEAHRIGLVDRKASPNNLLDVAEKAARGKTPSKRFHKPKRTGKGFKADLLKYLQEYALRTGYTSKSFNKLIKRLQGKDVLSQVVQQSQRGMLDFDPTGQLKNPGAALQVLLTGVRHGVDAGLEAERKEVLKFIASEKTKGAIRFHFAETAVKDAAKGAELDLHNERVAVIGAGVMGGGIATAFTTKGVPISVSDMNEEALARAKKRVLGAVDKEVSKKKLDQAESQLCRSNFETLLNRTDYGGASLVIEAVTEDADLKKKLLPNFESTMDEGSILASNTSSKSITDLATVLARPELFCGLHFFNPAEKMKLVEVVAGAETADETLAIAKGYVRGIGKLPVVVKDVPGFLVNRVLTRYLGESQHLLKDGFYPADIDLGGKHAGFFMGPISTLDLVGLDVAGEVLETLSSAYGERMECPTFAITLLEAGHLGKKSGKGFHDYSGKRGKPIPVSSPAELSELFSGSLDNIQANPSLDYIAKRLTYPLVDEAIRCLDSGVAGTPGKFAAQQIDVAMLYGAGTLALHAGPINWAERQGAQKIVDEMNRLADETGSSRFQPSDTLVERAKRGLSFFEAL